MKAEELWNNYKKIDSTVGDDFEAWAFGVQADKLAQLVLEGTKTATASAFDEHLYYDEPVGQVGDRSVILDSQANAVCIIEMTQITIVPFKEVSSDHAYKEGEGDRTLTYWRQVHQELFTEWLAELDITFSEDSKVVLEEFKVVYPLERD